LPSEVSMRDEQRDDQMMDRLLRETLAAPAPRFSPEFDSRVIRRIRPRRLTRAAWAGMTIYLVAAAGVAAWLMQEQPPTWIAAALVAGAAGTVGAGAYVKSLVAHS